VTTHVHLPGSRQNTADPEGWDILRRLAQQRDAIEDALAMLENCTEPLAIAARLRLARV
jgi:hypothetical protein